jgi:ribosome biogenesis GTPase
LSATPASRDALAPFGWNERVAALYNSHATDDDIPARVVRVDGDTSLLVTPHGDDRARIPGAVTGDWVRFSRSRETAEVLPRWSALRRQGMDGDEQVLAANIDVVLVVASLDRPLNPNRIERELVVVWDGNARPVVVLTKADLAPEGSDPVAELEERIVGVDVLLTSGISGQGTDALAELARPDLTVALLGPSGAGKSTLANLLLGEERMATAEVRAGDKKGRHTTTTRELIALPGGGVILDTPGLRALGLAGGDDGLVLAFPEIDELAADCRFRDCQHAAEPGCAVLAAVERGDLNPARLESYMKLLREQERFERQQDRRATAEHNRVTKRFFKEVRRIPNRPSRGDR